MNLLNVALKLFAIFKTTQELILLSKPFNSSITIGESAFFQCSVSEENHEVAWLTGLNILYVGNVPFNAPRRYLSESFSDKQLKISGSNLTITNLTREDDKSYTCSVKGSNISATAFLDVLTPPNSPVIDFVGSKVRYEGDFINLKCSSHGGNPAPQLVWKRNNSIVSAVQFIPPENKFGTTSTLLPWRLSAEDHLIDFTCSIPDVGTFSTTTFQVNYAPIISVGSYNPLLVVEGSNVTINCSASSNPPSQIYWERNNKTENQSSYFLAKISPTDEGSYVCHAKNFVEKQKILKLVILKLPIAQMALKHLVEMQELNETQAEKEIIIINDKEIVKINEFQSIQVVCKDGNAYGEENSWWDKRGGHGEQYGDVMLLEYINRHQSGDYTCIVSRNLQPSVGPPVLVTSSKQFHLSVLYRPGRSSIDLSNPIIMGRSAVLKCHATEEGYPSAEYVWFRDGKEIFKGKRLQFQARLSDSGTYTCCAFNVVGRGESDSKEVVVNELPEPLAIVQQSLVTVKAGECGEIKLKCSVRGHPSPAIKWLKNGQPIERLDFVQTTSEPINGSSFNVTSIFSLRGFEASLYPFSIMDAGNYTCIAKNIISEDTIVTTITVDVNFAPIITSKPQKFVKTHEYGFITFDLKSNPAPTIEWINGTETMLVNSSRFSIKTLSSANYTYRALLELNPVLVEDLQNYTLIATNECGNDTSVIQVISAECPEAPYNLTIASVSWESVEITWIEGYDGGFPQNFVVQITSTGNEFNHFTYFSDSTRIIISDLMPWNSYTIRVFGKNKIGKSKMSKEVVLPELSLNSPIKAEYLFNEQIVLLSLPKHIYANRQEANVHINNEIWRDICVRIDIFDGLSWIAEIPCRKEHKIFIGTSNVRAVEVKVFLCFEQRLDICSDGVFAKIDTSGKTIKRSVTIFVGSLCGTLILIFSVVVLVLCIRKPGKFDRRALTNEERNSEALGSNGSTMRQIAAASPLSYGPSVNESNYGHWTTSCYPFPYNSHCIPQIGDCMHTPSTGLSLFPLTSGSGFLNDPAQVTQPRTKKVVYEIMV